MTATATHTRGPWEAIPAKNEHGEGTISVRGRGEFIATMDTVSIGGSAYRLPDNGEANARLIASAPEMLEALSYIAETLENCHLDKDNLAQLARTARAAMPRTA